MRSAFKFLATRSIFFYAALLFLSLGLVDYDRIHERVAVRTLNDNMPGNFTYFLKVMEGDNKLQIDPQRFKEHADYYEIVVRYMPQLAEAHLMLGVSYFYLGRPREALRAIERSAVLNPHFFWAQFNRGILYYHRGDYKRSAQVLEAARQLKPQITLLVIKNSPIYSRLLHGVTNFGEIAMPNLKRGYSECYRLLVLSHLKVNDYAQVLRFSQEAISLGLDFKELFYYYAAVASYHSQQYPASIALLKQALDIDANFFEAYDYLAKTLAALGEEEKAQEIRLTAQKLQSSGVRKLPTDDVMLRIF